MVVLFNQEKFTSDLLKKAEKQGMYKEAVFELNEIEKQEAVEYLFIVSNFVKELDNQNIPTILRGSGGSSYIAYLLGINKVNPLDYGLTNIFFVRQLKIRFDICIPKQKKPTVINILNSLLGGLREIQSDSWSISFNLENGNRYSIGLLTNPCLDRLVNIEKESGLKISDISIHDQKILDFMLEPYDGGYYMPNLNGCYTGLPKLFYDCLKIAKPKTLSELAELHALLCGLHTNIKAMKESLKECDLEFTITSKEKLFSILFDTYEIDELNALTMVQDIIHGNLHEWEELLIQSREIPEYITKQFSNIKYLYYYAYGLQVTRIGYLLAYYKFYYKEQFMKVMDPPNIKGGVGPFFFLDDSVQADIKSASAFNKNLHFFDNERSHFDLFRRFVLDEDYGNYPRGRVIFDNYKKEYVIYIDRILNTPEIKDMILDTFDIYKTPYCFKYDEHYTHDGL